MATPIDSGGDVQGTEPTGESSPGQNPAWNEALSAIPEQFHQVLTPHFQKWDDAAQQRIESVNSQIKAYEPYKDFVDNGIAAEDLAQGIQFLYELNNNPQAVYEALGQAFGLSAQADPNAEEEEGDEGETQNFQDPRFDQLQQGLDLVAQTLVQQREQEVRVQAEKELDSELNSLREKFPNFDEKYVLSLVAEGATMEEAAQSYEALVGRILQQNPRPFAPTVMGNSGGGTGLPSQVTDPTKLDGKARRDLVAQMLRQQLSD